VLSYILAAVIAQIVVSLAASFVLPFEPRLWVADTLALLIAAPMPALIVRRCHDQDRTGKWAWLAAIAFAIWCLRSAVSLIWGYQTRIELDSYTWPLDLLATLCSVATLALLFLPGTKGPNRFGPDPRVRN
jgi:uncharacterized membrane protein YhaH (DUF805 family)